MKHSPAETPGYKLRECMRDTTSVKYAGFPDLTTCEAFFAEKLVRPGGEEKISRQV